MKYEKVELQKELNALVGKKIAEVYYYTDYEFFESFHQLSDKMECVLLMGVLLKTTDGQFFTINDADLFPEMGLGGMVASATDTPKNPADRKDHISKKQWVKYRDSEITAARIHEIKHTNGTDTFTVPLGISFDFANGEMLHVYNAYVDDYNSSTRKYELSRGESLTFFYDNDSLKGYKELADGLVVKIESLE